ncbi:MULTISPECIES: twin-arginine translocase TatA/TatE family subunit [Bacillaceae]|uniref:twin-arginine translocase TatA/TatE family subunit n=1 Tax=Bacillaceae TaxID=186817 RepID=UPI001C581643|nr:twin-arginine translocase TatA/TatE family subunit [Rossellomorea sp. YZS02]MBW3114616.1 twin-arginine translocase TatA/TatE family subunit [Bacillus sp. MCCB 382]MDX8345661.1 twin-arginine translocase TatA/TatE family subunit [Rossellomorea sp. YZS02]
MNLGFGEIAIILFVALLFFGPSKLPELGKAAGTSLREFKKAVSGLMDEDEQNKEEENDNIRKNNQS